MDISIFGLGYVGAVSAACLANSGHRVTGVDSIDLKVDMINKGESPIIEKDVDKLIKSAVEQQKLKAVTSPQEAIATTEISMICVGTPSQMNGNLDTSYIRRVCESIGLALRDKSTNHTVVIRSTTLPGTLKSVVIPTIEEFSGKKIGNGINICNNPEFLREGTAVYDFYNPPKTVIGGFDENSRNIVASIYKTIDAPLIKTTIEVAEMLKYVDNAWHALKVSFANEIGNICKALEIDSHDVMDSFCSDAKLNISSAYLKPGFAFGGSCLPKDLRAINYKAKTLDLNVPILNAILPSNENHIETALQLITQKKNRKVGFLGFSFKAGTDDLRESPVVEMIERLLGKGYELKIYDKNVNLSRLVGTNKDFILNKIPHISKLMVTTMEEVLEHSETIVIGNASEEFKNIFDFINKEQTIVDLVRIVEDLQNSPNYDGICW